MLVGHIHSSLSPQLPVDTCIVHGIIAPANDAPVVPARSKSLKNLYYILAAQQSQAQLCRFAPFWPPAFPEEFDIDAKSSQEIYTE